MAKGTDCKSSIVVGSSPLRLVFVDQCVVQGMPKTTHRLNAGRRWLYLRVKPSGAQSWVFRYMHDRKPRYLGLGSAASVSLATARSLAGDARTRRSVRRRSRRQARSFLWRLSFGRRGFVFWPSLHGDKAWMAFACRASVRTKTCTNGFFERRETALNFRS